MTKKMKEIIGRIMYKSRYVWSWYRPGETVLWRLWNWVRDGVPFLRIYRAGTYYETEDCCHLTGDIGIEYPYNVVANGWDHDDLVRVYHMYFDTQNTTVVWRKDAEPVRCDGGQLGA